MRSARSYDRISRRKLGLHSDNRFALNLLIDGLNAGNTRVRELLVMSQELRKLYRRGPRSKYIEADPQVDDLAQAINIRLERYNSVPIVYPFRGRLVVRRDRKGTRMISVSALKSTGTDADSDWNGSAQGREFLLVSLLMDAVANDLLSKVGHCGCGKFFLARSLSSRFCSKACRVEYWENSEPRKAEKRRMAREYYKQHKNNNTK